MHVYFEQLPDVLDIRHIDVAEKVRLIRDDLDLRGIIQAEGEPSVAEEMIWLDRQWSLHQ